MRLLSLFAMCFLLGCHSVTSSLPEQKTEISALTGPWLSLDEMVEHVSIDKTGRYILVSGGHFGAELYEVASLKKSKYLKISAPHGLTNGSGFIDSNIFYWGYTDYIDTFVEIWRISPGEKIFSHKFEGGRANPLVANDGYVAYPDKVISWRNGSSTMSALHAHPGEVGGYVLTDSGRVFSRNLLGETLLLHDPKTNQRWYWSAGIMPFDAALTRSERYAIAIDDTGACKVWRMPEIEPLDRCGWGAPFTQKQTRLVVAPHAERFAVSVEDQVRVYSLEPYSLINEFHLPATADALALTDEGRLAVADSQGRLSVWDSTTGAALGHAEPGRVRELTFQAEVRLLAIASKGERYGLYLYDIPKQSNEPNP